jgi:replication factor C subunit 3/5
MFLIDKYRPDKKEDSEFHKDVLDMLEIMSNDDAIPHLILYGPDGSGKRTIINIFLEMLFKDGVKNTKDTLYDVVSSGGKRTSEKVKQSNYHIEINPKGTNYDRYLVHDIVKEYARNKSLNAYFENKQFKLVLINNADTLSSGAQMALRRTMELYSDKCRFILWCKNLTKLIKELQSRCIKLRIPAPTDSEMFKYVFKVSIKEKIYLDLDGYTKLVSRANGNIKKALWELQFIMAGYEMNTEYINTLNTIINLLLKANLNEIENIRECFFNSMITNYTGTNILIDLVHKIYELPQLPKEIKQKIISKAAETEYRLMKGRRKTIHLDNSTVSTINTISNFYRSNPEKIKN